MPSEYRLIRYVPDTLADERVTIGVVVLGDRQIFVRCINRWDRIRCWAGAGVIELLKEFALDMEREQSDLDLRRPSPYTAESIVAAASHWKNCIQFSEARGSLLPADQLLRDVVQRFLRKPRLETRTQVRDKRTVRLRALQTLRKVSKTALGKYATTITGKPLLKGALDEHKFDTGVKNGHLLSAGIALSFELVSKEDLRKDIDAAAWAVDDVRKRQADLFLSVLTFPPRKDNESMYAKARHIFEGLSARFVQESEFGSWAREEVGRVPGTTVQPRLPTSTS
jgi:hypothetical protein